VRIALIAHDKCKPDMLRFAGAHRETLARHALVATGTTGKLVAESTGLPVQCYLSGPMGGDQQIGSEIASGRVDCVIFLRDPLTAHPHEPDVSALLRLCDVRSIPVATNVATARGLVAAIEAGVYGQAPPTAPRRRRGGTEPPAGGKRRRKG
jgi:methylglyoxal synthase